MLGFLCPVILYVCSENNVSVFRIVSTHTNNAHDKLVMELIDTVLQRNFFAAGVSTVISSCRPTNKR